MDSTVPQSAFHRALRLAGRAVPTRPALPILHNVVIEARDGTLTLTATDLEVGVVTTIGAEVAAAGRVAVPARLLADFIERLPPDPVHLTLDPARPRLQVRCGRFTAGFAMLDPQEFPALGAIDGATICLDARRLREAIERVVFAAARDDSRPVLKAVCLRCGPDGLTLAAADGFRLGRVRVPGAVLGSSRSRAASGAPGAQGAQGAQGDGEHAAPAESASGPELHEALIPARAGHEFVRVLADGDAAELRFASNGSTLQLRVGQTTLHTRLVEGAFPDVERVIPQEATGRLTVETAALRQAVAVAALFGSNGAGRLARLDAAPERLQLAARGDETGDAESVLPATLVGAPQRVTLDTTLLADVLAVAASKYLELALNGPASPVLLREFGRDEREAADHVWIVMPLFDPEASRTPEPAPAARPAPSAAAPVAAAADTTGQAAQPGHPPTSGNATAVGALAAQVGPDQVVEPAKAAVPVQVVEPPADVAKAA